MTKYIAILLLAFSGSAFGNFKCTIKDAVNLEKNGLLNHQSYLATKDLGKEFVVNRGTGLITGAGIVNNMSGQMPTVYDYLPQENGYKAVTIYKPNNTVDYLQINLFAEAKEKPFFYMGAWGTMVSGTCVNF